MQKMTKIWKYAPIAASAILLLALIVVSAFAYQWHGENKELKTSNQTLRALNDQSTLGSLLEENNALQESVVQLTNEKEQLELKIENYEKILTDNDLMPE